MKALVLAAGYATRLYPLTENYPKALLKVGDRPILDYIIEDLNTIEDVNEIIIISNERYYDSFINWNKELNNIKPITIINDGSTSNENRLGAIGDIIFALKKQNINEDTLIIASDTVFTFKLLDFYNYFKEKQAPCVAVNEVNDLDILRRCGVAQFDNDYKLIGFEEKPAEPKSNFLAFALYIYPKETLPIYDQYVNDGNLIDAPGNFLTYLYNKIPVYAYKVHGEVYDIGTHETLAQVDQMLKDKVNNK